MRCPFCKQKMHKVSREEDDLIISIVYQCPCGRSPTAEFELESWYDEDDNLIDRVYPLTGTARQFKTAGNINPLVFIALGKLWFLVEQEFSSDKDKATKKRIGLLMVKVYRDPEFQNKIQT